MKNIKILFTGAYIALSTTVAMAQQATSTLSGTNNIDWLIKSGGTSVETEKARIDVLGSAYQMGSMGYVAGSILLTPGIFSSNNTEYFSGSVGILLPDNKGSFKVEGTSSILNINSSMTKVFNTFQVGLNFEVNSTKTKIGNELEVKTINSGSSTLNLRTNGSNRLSITTAGNVGIGTTAPTNKLEVVNGNFRLQGGKISVRTSNSIGTEDAIKIEGYSGGYVNIGTGNINAAPDYGQIFLFSPRPDQEIMIRPQSNSYFMGVNVGIGTKNPTSLLTVKGQIKAEEIIVTLNIPASDYVFESDYNLRSLEELESFVTTNKHLPEVPSAKEFAENGYDIGKFDDLLLRKVEELTLYIIEQNKQIQELQRQINSK